MSLRWSPGERREWRETDRSLLNGPFEPRARDDRELRWYFLRGKRNALRGLSAEQQKTWRRIHRNLDGRGYNLMLHYTGAAAPDAMQLRLEYRAYVQNSGRSHAAAGWEPYLVADRRQLIGFLKPSSFQTAGEAFRTFGVGHVWQVRETEDVSGALADALRSADLSTWGDLRVSPKSARIFLEYGCAISMLEARHLLAEEVLEMLTTQLAKLPPTPEPTLLDDALPELDAKDAKERPKLERAEIKQLYHQAPSVGQNDLADVYSVTGQALAPGFWKRSSLDPDSDESVTMTQVAEYVRRYVGLRDHKWVRRKLQKLGCPGALTPGARLPLSWFRGERARDLWTAAEQEKRARDLQQMVGSDHSRFSARGRRR